nr:basic salivary proline-rich protein 3-like [Aegilops tauschii subsp. strangulata]
MLSPGATGLHTPTQPAAGSDDLQLIRRPAGPHNSNAMAAPPPRQIHPPRRQQAPTSRIGRDDQVRRPPTTAPSQRPPKAGEQQARERRIHQKARRGAPPRPVSPTGPPGRSPGAQRRRHHGRHPPVTQPWRTQTRKPPRRPAEEGQASLHQSIYEPQIERARTARDTNNNDLLVVDHVRSP